MKNILTKHYNTKLNINEISTDLFSGVDMVSVAVVITRDRLVEDIKFISVHEGLKNARLLSPKEYIKDDGRTYLILVNHPNGFLSPSNENASLYKGLKLITSNVDVIQVCKDKCVWVSIDTIFKFYSN